MRFDFIISPKARPPHYDDAYSPLIAVDSPAYDRFPEAAGHNTGISHSHQRRVTLLYFHYLPGDGPIIAGGAHAAIDGRRQSPLREEVSSRNSYSLLRMPLPPFL